MKDIPMKNKTLYIILAGLMFILLACGDDGNNNIATPLPPDKPLWYTPEPPADYSVWPTVDTIHYFN